MSNLQYYAYPGVGVRNRDQYGYQQAVRVGDRIECSGQGGWNPKTGEFTTEINAQIAEAFENVDLCLKDAGGKGMYTRSRPKAVKTVRPDIIPLSQVFNSNVII
jgi:enamine deaminase RidA (YjgF/YER057c/UK114 family)